MHVIRALKELPDTTCIAPIGVTDQAKITMWSLAMEDRGEIHTELIGWARRNNKCSIQKPESVGKLAIESE